MFATFAYTACLTAPKKRNFAQRAVVVLMRRWYNICDWWPRHAKIFDVTTFGDVRYYELPVDYRSWVLYTKDGDLYGWHGQNVNGEAFFTPAATVHGDKRVRMAWLSRIRSPRID